MSIDEAGSGALDTTAKKGTRSRPAKVRKHKHETVFKQGLAAHLDKLHADGQTIAHIIPSGDVRGFEVVSYTEE